MKNYYYISDSVYKAFPDLQVSKPFSTDSNGSIGYIAVVEDFTAIEDYYKEQGEPLGFFAYELIDSQVDLRYDAVDYDEDDNEIEVIRHLNLEVCQDWGLVQAIEQELGLTTERNVAYTIYKLAEKYDITPIEFVNKTVK